MDELTTTTTVAGPLGDLAANFYFSPFAVARAESIGLDVVSLYGAGRGGVIAGATPTVADETFFFFKPGMIASMVEKGRSLAAESAILDAHLAAASDYAETTFARVDEVTLLRFAELAEKVAAGAPKGNWPIFDGYFASPTPATAAAKAYRGAILLRELRGGIHTDAVKAAGLSAATACQFDRDDFYFRMHGFGDDDVVELTPEVEALKASTEQATNAAMAERFAVLSAEERAGLVEGTHALVGALS
ncbi:MAG: hypothetical protein WCK25_01455 [Actinomycetes bacterium]